MRTAITSHLHYGIGLILSVLGLFFIGLSEDEDDNSKHLSTLLAGRGLQGFGYGYFISFCTISPNLDHHLFREDTATDSQRKMIMQLCFVLGLTLGYPITEKVTKHKLVFWGMAGATLVTGIATFLSTHGRKLSQHTADASFKLSLMTILFKKVVRQLLREP